MLYDHSCFIHSSRDKWMEKLGAKKWQQANKRTEGFAGEVETWTRVTVTASQQFSLQFIQLQPVCPQQLKPQVPFTLEIPSSLSYSSLCCWPVKNVHSTWFRSPTAPLDPISSSLKWVMNSLHLWSGGEERRVLVRKNRAGARWSRRPRLNEGCNYQLFKTLNHGVARYCCTNTDRFL